MARSMETAGWRNAYMLIFRTDPADHGGVIIPNYDHVAEMVCGYLSLLFGKRFDNHGSVESSGFFNLPDLSKMEAYSSPNLPQNAASPRADAPIPLDLAEIRRLIPLLFGSPGHSEEARVFRGATKFYLQALQAVEHDVEVAYLHLITAGEILSGAVNVNPDCLLDAATRAILSRIESELRNGAHAARLVRSKLRSVKRRFIVGFENLIEPEFFNRSEATRPYSQLKQASFTRMLSAAYDLRSRYVHTGRSFGGWIAPRGAGSEEVQSGKPIVDDKEYGRILAAAPTYVGLERIVRYGLLKFAARLEVDLLVGEAE
jgi:hypothetical protein